MKITLVVENDDVRETLEEEFDVEKQGLLVLGLVCSTLTRTFDAEYAKSKVVEGEVEQSKED